MDGDEIHEGRLYYTRHFSIRFDAVDGETAQLHDGATVDGDRLSFEVFNL